MTREQHKEVVDRIRVTAGEQAGALISDDLANLVNDYSAVLMTAEESASEIAKLKEDNANLIDTNGKLFQKVGFEKVEEKSEDAKEADEEVISLTDIINEKGEMI